MDQKTTISKAQTLDFRPLKIAIANQFKKLAKGQLFRTTTPRDTVWETYLASFPEGTNPIYRERTEHDCACCRSFVKNLGNVVGIVDGQLVSIWDIKIAGPYQVVVDALSERVKADPIENLFLHMEGTVGTDKNFEQLVNDSKTWEHFFVNLPAEFVVSKGQSIGAALSDPRATHDVMLRGLTEITDQAVAAVLELISQNSIYRGEEHKFAVTSFQKLKTAFGKLKTDAERDLFVWANMLKDKNDKSVPQSVSRIRNTSIGTLLVDLSNDVDLDVAVKSFEKMVAPENYKRPTALVTKAMIEQARETITNLGLMSALERRYAVIEDITINNVLHANRMSKPIILGNVFDELSSSVAEKPKNFDKVETISIEKFLSDVLPKAESVEVLFENKHLTNLVSLVAPVDPTAGQLFKWPNNFSWAYNGELADSDMRRAVQERGGRVDGVFRFTHSWNHPGQRNGSLMDLHVFMPGNTITANNHTRGEAYGNQERVGWNHRSHNRSGGVQDVDYTSVAPEGYIPVENITFPRLEKMPEGTYICKIHNWNARQPNQGGFKAEIEFDGEIYQYEYEKPLKNHEWVTVASVTLKNGKFTIQHHLPLAGASVKEAWGLKTQTWNKVNVVMLSPNHWDGQGVGNRHYFFMLEGAVNDGTARGFFNEFLRSDLDKHRKAFEMVGSKMQTEESPRQLSGLGFSSTQRNEVIVRVKGALTRVLKIAI